MPSDHEGMKFDPVTAAEQILRSKALADELASEAALRAAGLEVAEVLRGQGIDLGLGEGQSVADKLDLVDKQMTDLAGRLRTLRPQNFPDNVLPGSDPQYEEVVRQNFRVHRLARLLGYTDLIALHKVLGDTTPKGELEKTIVDIGTDTLLEPTEKEALLNTLETTVGAQAFSEAMATIGKGDHLERQEGEDQARARAVAEELVTALRVNRVLRDRLGVGNINHEDWSPLAHDLLQAMQLRKDGTGEQLQTKLNSIRERAERLGVDEATLGTVLSELDIVTE